MELVHRCKYIVVQNTCKNYALHVLEVNTKICEECSIYVQSRVPGMKRRRTFSEELSVSNNNLNKTFFFNMNTKSFSGDFPCGRLRN